MLFLYRLCFLTTAFSSSVQEEVDRGSFLLPVCAGHPGKHPVRPEHPPEEPRLGSGREKLPGASLALAHRQPRHPDVRPYCILLKKKIKRGGGCKTQLLRWGLWGVCSPTYMPHFRQACTCSLSGLVTACVGTSCVARAPPMLMGNEDVGGDKTGAQLH